MTGLPSAIIFDIDGTLVDVKDLRPWVTGKRKDFHKFHTLAMDAPPILETVWAAQRSWDAGHQVVIVTARDETYKAGTMDWLYRHGVPYHEIHMRPKKDFRPDREIKEEILKDLQERYNIVGAWDDNPSVIQLWRDNGIMVNVVSGWED